MPATTWRDALEGAHDSLASEDDGPDDTAPPEAAPEGASAGSEGTDAKASTPAEPSEAKQDEKVEEAAPHPKDGARDEKGKFLPKAKVVTPKPSAGAPAPKGQQAAKDGGPVVTTKPVVPSERAPQSWSATEREAWASLPPAAKAAVARREKEIATALNEAAPLRQRDAAWSQVLTPHLPMIQSMGRNPLQVVHEHLQTGAMLRNGTPGERAKVIADIIQTFGGDLDLINAHLSGQPAQQQQQPQAHMDARAIAEQVRREVLEGIQKERGQAAYHRSAQEVEDFASQAPEFFEDVRQDMADMMELAARRGIELSLEDAYNRAVKVHPEVSRALQQREEARQANARIASTQQSRAASSSLRSTPAGPSSGGPQPKGLRDILERTWDAKSGQSR